MQSITVASAGHYTSGKFIYNKNLTVFDNILLVTVHNSVGMESLVDVMLQLHIFGIGKVFDTKALLGFLCTPFGKRCRLCLFVNYIIRVDVNIECFIVMLGKNKLFKTFRKHIRNSVKLVCILTHAGNDKRSSCFVDKN